MITLIGHPESKRTFYFCQAASRLQEHINVVNYDQALTLPLNKGMVKIDPPLHQETDIRLINTVSQNYIGFLQKMATRREIHFINPPKGIIHLLDKRHCKHRLIEHAIPTPPILADGARSYDQLIACMRSEKVYRVFIKPNFGSGAAGVLALSLHPGDNRQVLYCAIQVAGNRLVNSKHIIRYENSDDITLIVNTILQQDNIIERWLAKARVGNKRYDLRIVYVNGEIVWRVVRTSSQPITNLHLQNEAIRFADLNLPAEKVAEIDTLCLNAMKLYPDVHIAGLDVLLTQKLTPYIIEINGQGDLIYQDTCEQNKIYQRQIQVMREHHV